MVITEQLQAILDEMRIGTGHVLIRARAGSGKTTGILLSVDEIVRAHPTWEIQVCAYNKPIAVEIDGKLKVRGHTDFRKVGASTVHSMGFGLVRFVFNSKVDGLKVRKIVRQIMETGGSAQGQEFYQQYKSQIERLTLLAKQEGVGFFDDKPIMDSHIWYQLADHYDINGFDDTSMMDDLVSAAQFVYRASLNQTDIVDFDDMILFPLIKNLSVRFQKDVIFVDEAQDLSRARQALIRKFIKPSGRIIIVGDDRQAIYGFCHLPGTKILTPEGDCNIEKLKQGYPHIAVNTSGDVAGWQGNYRILKTGVFQGWDRLVEIKAAGKKIQVTPHHKLPVKIPEEPGFYVYMMRRAGKYRVGYLASHTTAGGHNERRFMLSQRCKMEQADAAWILSIHNNRLDAIIQEAELHKRGAFGGSFIYLDPDEIDRLPQNAEFYINLLTTFGRMHDFPIWCCNRRQHFEINLPFITEACNIVPGMRVQILGDWDTRKRGRSRHLGDWHPVEISYVPYNPNDVTYSITTTPLKEGGVGKEVWPLYVANGIVVHNSGADSEALDRLSSALSAKLLPLTCTWRCPSSVVSLAQTLVSDIEAAPDAQPGLVDHCDELPGDLSKDDAILCRNTAPLIDQAYALIRKGIACKVEGKEIGEGLKELFMRWRVKTLDAFVNKLELYREREVQKALAKDREDRASNVNDRCDTAIAIVRECQARGKTLVTDAVQFVDDLFADGAENVLILATYHRSKGREWNRVFLYEHGIRCPSRYAKQEWQLKQEENLAYVSFTRAKQQLWFYEPEER